MTTEQPGWRTIVAGDTTIRAYGPPFSESEVEPIMRARAEGERYRANMASVRERLTRADREWLLEVLDVIIATTKADPRHLMDCAPLAQTHDRLAQLRHDLEG